MKHPKNFVGEKFGKLTVVARDKLHCICVCDCKTIKRVRLDNLRQGSIRSCGCGTEGLPPNEKMIMRDQPKSACAKAWANIRKRCYSPSNPDYKNYGGRGIKMSKKWPTAKAFYEWSMANGYKHGLWIERLDNNKDYGPDNCAWVTPTAQARNKRNNLYVDNAWGGRTLLVAFAEQHGISKQVARDRYHAVVARGFVPTEDDILGNMPHAG